MPFGVSLPELLILLVVLLLVFGAKRLPEMGKSLGKGMREFKDAVSGEEDTTPKPTATATANRVELPPAPPAPAPPAPTTQNEPETHQTVS